MSQRKRKTVLLAEDETDLGQLVHQSLNRAGYRTIVVNDGIDALNFILERRPDLIVLDVRLPRLQGHEICALVRKSPTVHGTPIIVMSGNGTDESKLRAFELGADDYVTKPFRMEELVARVDAVLRRATQDMQPTPFLAHSNS